MAILESVFGDPNESPNMLMRFGTALQGGQAQAAMDEMYRKKREESALAKLAPRIQAGDKAALMELAVMNPQAATALAQFSPQSEYKVVGDQLVEIKTGAEPRFIKSPNSNKPLTDVAKLKSDLDAGLIDKETYDRRLAKEVAPTEKNYKQFQLQNAAFADMMVKAEETLQPYEKLASEGKFDPVNEMQAGLSGIPSFGLGGYLGNLALSEDQQKYKQAQEAWVRAKLRKESGAAIGTKEMADEIATFFPRAGDKPEVIKQKAIMRDEATKSMQKQTGGAYDDMYAPGETVETTTQTTKKRVKFSDL